MSSHIQSLVFRVLGMRRRLDPPPPAQKWLPTAYLDEAGRDVAGCEETNARATRYAALRHIAVKEYVGFTPNLDGGEV